jgi:hypothetical protein
MVLTDQTVQDPSASQVQATRLVCFYQDLRHGERQLHDRPRKGEASLRNYGTSLSIIGSFHFEMIDDIHHCA